MKTERFLSFYTLRNLFESFCSFFAKLDRILIQNQTGSSMNYSAKAFDNFTLHS